VNYKLGAHIESVGRCKIWTFSTSHEQLHWQQFFCHCYSQVVAL